MTSEKQHLLLTRQAKQWQLQLAAWRKDIGAPVTGITWRPQWDAACLPKTARVQEILDTYAFDRLKARTQRDVQSILDMPMSEKRKILRHDYVDVSQNPRYIAKNHDDGQMSCICTGSNVYSFGRDRVLLPVELMYLQGHRRGLEVPDNVRCSRLRQLAGEGMSLPSLGSIIWSMYLLHGLP